MKHRDPKWIEQNVEGTYDETLWCDKHSPYRVHMLPFNDDP